MSKSNFVPVTIEDIIAPIPELKLSDSILVLRAEDSRRFAISIDNLTGMTLIRILAGGKIAMPILDLFIMTLATMDIPIKKMVLNLDGFHNFYFMPFITKGEGQHVVTKLELSDGLNLAVKSSAPIFISEEAAKASIIDEKRLKDGMEKILTVHEFRCKLQEQVSKSL